MMDEWQYGKAALLGIFAGAVFFIVQESIMGVPRSSPVRDALASLAIWSAAGIIAACTAVFIRNAAVERAVRRFQRRRQVGLASDQLPADRSVSR